MASSSRARSSSPFGFRRPSPINGRITIPRYPPAALNSSSSSYGSGYAAPRSLTPNRVRSGDYSSNFRFGTDSLPELVTADTASSDNMDFQRSKENICVTIRFRPLSVREHHKGDEVAWYPDGDTLVRNEYNPSTAYAFDKVFGPATTTKGVYDVAARHVVRAAMEGVNGTVFAYGVTSSGKTHTMHGDQRSPGIIPLAIKDVFSIIQDTPGQEFLLRVSYLEIYNEVINDLLDPTGQNLRVREDVQGTYVEGIKEEVVLSPAHALSFIAAGEEHRHVGSNNFNLLSSRSHTIFTLTVESSVPGSDDEVTLSQLNLIDLAGSESSKTETTGLRRKEGSYINKSLLTLGTVIGKLSEGKASHIPYRDSKLTRLLQSSLSGHGHVSLICTITPASSNMEETHNTLKFAQRAKRVAIRAAPNRIIDEKSLIKKYQKEITILKHELDHLKKGILVTTSQEELITLRQQLEAGQVQMQSRLEEEEQAKAALMSRIQRLTKLILVSTKNTIPSNFPDNPSHQRRHSFGEDEKLDVLLESSAACAENETSLNESPASAALTLPLDLATEMKAGTRRSSSKRSDEQFPSIDSFVDSTQVGELFSGTVRGRKPPPTGTTMMDQMDLLTEQVKMLAGEVAFSSSSLKRLSEQAANNPEDDKIRAQTQKLEDEIEEKKRQMKVLKQRITGSSLAASNNASPVEMQQTIAKLMSQYNEKAFELEIKSADNRILQERLEAKESENKQLHETILSMRQQSSSASERSSQHENVCADELAERRSDGELPTDENRKRGNDEEWHGQILLQASEIEKLKQDNIRLNEENGGLHIQSQKLSEEASYAKELASAAAVELKNLAEEVTRLSFQNAKLTKELAATQETLSARGSVKQGLGNGQRKSSESKIRKARAGNRTFEAGHGLYDDVDSWSLGVEDMKRELHARKEREAALEAALADKEQIEAEYQMKIDEAKRRETDLENDLAGMWVLVAKLKKEAVKNAEARIAGEVEHDCHSNGTREGLKVQGDDISMEEKKDADMLEQLRTSLEAEKRRGAEMASLISQLKSEDLDELEISALENLQLLHAEALTKLLEAKARMQEKLMKGTERESNGGNGNNNEETNAHVCKVCFEYATEAVLIPCRHFCLCKTCAVACTECPLCRTKIEDRIITFTS